MTGWTAEQLQNAMTYGICFTCKAPREARRSENVVDGRTEVSFAIVCPNSHDQDKWLEFDDRSLLEERGSEPS